MEYEIIAPCARIEELELLLELGVDAVYVGISGWSRSNRGMELSLPEIKEAVELVHSRSCRLYISFNLIPSPFENKMVFRILERILSIGVDAFIVSDVHLIKLLSSWGAEVHASLGTSSINREDILFYRDIGASRVVISPNLSVEEIREIRESVCDVDLEVMVHGIKCGITYLGICRLSSYFDLLITNSGVRTLVWEGSPKRSGICYRPCAQEWSADEKNLCFSPLVNARLYSVEELAEAGIRHFKIGGRGMPLSFFKNVIENIKEALGGKCRNV